MQWQSLPGHLPHHCRYPSSRWWMNPLLPREGTKSFTVATCIRCPNPSWKGPGSRRAGSGLLGKGHSQQCFSPQCTPSPWEWWWQQKPVCREWAREIRCQTLAAGLQLLHIASCCRLWMLALVYQQFMLQKFDKIPQRLIPPELHPCCHNQFVLWLCSGDVSASTYARGPDDLIQPSLGRQWVLLMSTLGQGGGKRSQRGWLLP